MTEYGDGSLVARVTMLSGGELAECILRTDLAVFRDRIQHTVRTPAAAHTHEPTSDALIGGASGPIFELTGNVSRSG